MGSQYPKSAGKDRIFEQKRKKDFLFLPVSVKILKTIGKLKTIMLFLSSLSKLFL